MFDIPTFFIDQRIDQDADERTVKRAYAKALKQVDQDNDLEGFQSLREGYERALAWVRSKDWREHYIAEQNAESEQPIDADSMEDHTVTKSREETPSVLAVDEANVTLNFAPAPTTGHIGETETQDVSLQLIRTDPDSENQTLRVVENEKEQIVYAIDIARHIFNAFLQQSSEKSEEVGQTEFLLHMYLDDERLINVEIRDLFECLIAERLSQGWQAGNGDLFGTAVKCFCWDQDRNRLLRFHDFGYCLDRAVDEMSAFNLQVEARRIRQIELIRRARNDAPPTKQFLREESLLIKDMLANYPTWLAMVTKFENLQTWHKRVEEYQFFQPPKFKNNTLEKFAPFADLLRLIVLILFMLPAIIFYFSQ